MFEDTTFKGTRQMRRLVSPAVGMTLLLLAGAACGTKSQSSPATAAATSVQESAAASATSPGPQSIVSRANPSSEQVAVAIAQAKQRIRMDILPSEGHARAFGDATCTAFDEGKTAPQVRGLVMQAASQLQSITVSSADADFAVGTAVNLFCPGYATKLSS